MHFQERNLRISKVHVVSPLKIDIAEVLKGIARLNTGELAQFMKAQVHKETCIAYVGGHES